LALEEKTRTGSNLL